MDQDIFRMIEQHQVRTLSTHLNYVRESFRKDQEMMENRMNELMRIAFGHEDEFWQTNLFSFIRRHRAEERHMENLFEDFIRKSQWRQHRMHQQRRMRDLEVLMRRLTEMEEDDEDEEEGDVEYQEIDIMFKPMA